MDPLGTVQFVLGTINYLKTEVDKVRENKHECKRLCSHAGALSRLIKTEFKGGVPSNVQRRLSKLANTLHDLSGTIGELAEGSWLKRTIARNGISSQIQQAYRDISETVQELNLGLLIDLSRFQRENDDARRKDEERARRQFERILQKETDVLQVLQIQKGQIQEALLCLDRYIRILPRSIERRLFEDSRSALLHRTRSPRVVPDEFMITSFDVIIFYDQKLGEGGFAKVYEADWQGTRVAVKKLDENVDPAIIQREIDVWKRLRHPHVLQFLAACTVSEPSFLVCSLKTNKDIMKYLLRNPKADRTQLLYHASLGLSYLHSNNIVHGDLKGANILVDEHGTACIADFGLSKIKMYSTIVSRRAHAAGGTLRWMSPESMISGVSTLNSDVYSFGMTMYEVYSGSPPFEASPDSSLLSIVYERGIRPARLDGALRHNVGLSETIESIMVRCWRQAADERPSAIDVSRRMARLLSIPLQQGAEPVKRDLSHSSIVQVVSSSVENSLPDPLPRHVQTTKRECTVKTKDIVRDFLNLVRNGRVCGIGVNGLKKPTQG
ncbi:hypothetical protein EIP86_008849 [Pleurotus ostreatoroseus]|nr:hypothetical protein EIP86_008849 [Pleurotus ostreatoroseus]